MTMHPNLNHHVRRHPVAEREAVEEFLFVDRRLIQALLMFRCYRRGRSLRYEIFLLTGHAVVKWPPMNDGKLFWKITMSRRVGGSPFQCRGVPRIALSRAFTGKNTHEEVRQKDQLRGPENEGGD